jgi:uncharacterized protein (TIGR02246 family)
MTTVLTKADQEAEIRTRLDDWARASRAKDIDGIMASYAPDLLSFDCHSQLQLEGAEALRRHLEICFSCMQGPMLFEIHDLHVTAQDDVAFCHYLARCGGTGTDGTEHVGWMRATACLRKANGKWLIVHDHFSAPFDPESGRAMLELEPSRSSRRSRAVEEQRRGLDR